MTKDYSLQIEGFYSAFSLVNVPDKSGIYFVFGGIDGAEGSKSCSIRHLIYIGESKDVQDRLTHHEKKALFDAALTSGEQLFFAYCLVDGRERELCEKGLINHFSHAFAPNLINVLSTKHVDSSYDELCYRLIGAVPRIFNDADRSFTVRTNI